MAFYFCKPSPVWTRDRVTVREDEERKRGKKRLGEGKKKGEEG